MNKIITALKSRTVWTIVAMVIINGVPSVGNLIPVEYKGALDVILGLLATYFRVNPRV